jgi:hypothetical protein
MSLKESSVKCSHNKGFNCRRCWPYPTEYHFKVDLGSRHFIHSIRAFSYDQARNIVKDRYPASAMIGPV